MTTARHAERRHGAAAAELAILLPFILLLFAVAVDFCRLYYQTQTLQNSAYAGALAATATAVPGATPSETLLQSEGASLDQARIDAAKQAAVAEAVSLGPPLSAGAVAVSLSGNRVTVRVTYDCKLLTPVLGASRSKTITREVTMRLAN
jgi:Flp pilus assembly protein TadG